jgi:amidohydrolase
MLRFDMDALPILEQTGAEYASQNEGVMHACGHDGHMAIGLGVASVFHEIQNDLPGSAVLLFQPAEEGAGGAKRMISEGVLDKVSVDNAIGMHIWNGKPVGWLGTSEGACMAGSDSFDITISGQGGHAAVPQHTHDPILAAAHIITSLQSIISRKVDPLEAAVLSITQIHAGDAFNVIPSEVLMRGTVRTFSDEIRKSILAEMNQIIHQQAESFHCQANLRVDEITPPLINQPSATARVLARFGDVQPDLSIDKNFQVLGSEDMAFFLEEIPGCYFFLGSANSDRKLDASHHNPLFDFDESVLSQAVYLCVQATLALMEQI